LNNTFKVSYATTLASSSSAPGSDESVPIAEEAKPEEDEFDFIRDVAKRDNAKLVVSKLKIITIDGTILNINFQPQQAYSLMNGKPNVGNFIKLITVNAGDSVDFSSLFNILTYVSSYCILIS
jgi:hypothetical protein